MMVRLRHSRMLLVVFVLLIVGCTPQPTPPTTAPPQPATTPPQKTDPEPPIEKPQSAENRPIDPNSKSATQANPKSPSVVADKIPRFYDRVVAICIGIQNYQFPGVTIAVNADQEAKAMANLFANDFGFEVVTLIGPDATKARILSTLEKWKRELNDRDALIVFFAGHGKVIDLPSFDRAGFLVPYDADLELEKTRAAADWERHAISMATLTEGTVSIKAQHVLFIVNACCSGFMANRGGGVADRPDNQQLMIRRSRSVITATTENQSSVAGGETRTGAFHQALQKRLKRAEAVSVMDAFVAIRQEVVRESKSSMIPQLGRYGSDDGEFIFIPKSIPANEMANAITSMEAAANLRKAEWTKVEHLWDLLDPPHYKSGSKRVELEKVWQSRLSRFQRNAGLGDPLALVALAICYQRGHGLERPDLAQAELYARRALETKRPEGKFAWGLNLLEATQRNEPNALQLLKQSSDEGFILANVLLADRMLIGNPSPSEQKQADELLAKAESAGIPSAVVRRVGLAQKSGAMSDGEKRQWATKLVPAADAGVPAAQVSIYQLLRSLPKMADSEKGEAEKRLQQAAESGQAEAQYYLAAECYQKDGFTGVLGRSQDFTAARLWATAAAEQSQLDAMKLLATMYIQGDGVTADLAKAKGYAQQVQAKRRDKADIDWLVWFTTKELRFSTRPR